MRYALCLFFILICNATNAFIDPIIYYKKIKQHIQQYRLSTYGASIISILALGSFYFFKKIKPFQKTSPRALPLFYKPTSLAKQKGQLKLSFLVIDPETKEAKNIIDQPFNYYRAKFSPHIDKINLISTEELCRAVRETLHSKNQNKYKSYNIVMYDYLIPEDEKLKGKKYFCDAGFIVGTTLFTLIEKNASPR